MIMVNSPLVLLFSKIAKHWQPITIVVLLVYCVISTRNMSAYKGAIEAQAENHKEDVRILNMFHQKEIDEQNRIIKEFEEKMEALIKENEEAVKDLQKRKSTNVSKNIKDFNENPSEIISGIEELWGFTNVQ